MPTQIHGLEVATRSKTKSRAGLAGLGRTFATEINGQMLTCKKYQRGPKGQIRCEKMQAGGAAGGPYAPSESLRKKAGIKSPFNYRRAGAKKPGTRAKGRKSPKKAMKGGKHANKTRTVNRERAKILRGPNKGRIRPGCTTSGAPKGKARCTPGVAKNLPSMAAVKKAKSAGTKKKKAGTKAKGRKSPAKKSTARKSATKRKSPAKSTVKATVVVDLCKAQTRAKDKNGKMRTKTVSGCIAIGGGKAKCTPAVAKRVNKKKCTGTAKKKAGTKAKGRKKSRKVSQKGVAAAYRASLRAGGTKAAAMSRRCIAQQVAVPAHMTKTKEGKRRDGCTNRNTCSQEALLRFDEGRKYLRRAHHLGKARRCSSSN